VPLRGKTSASSNPKIAELRAARSRNAALAVGFHPGGRNWIFGSLFQILRDTRASRLSSRPLHQKPQTRQRFVRRLSLSNKLSLRNER
jgi:hypothetical protein